MPLRPVINLDNNATTRMDPRVLEVMNNVVGQEIGNPSSRHQLGRAARRILNSARKSIRDRLDAGNSAIIFTSGATESNNLAILGSAGEPGSHILVSAIEHPSALAPAMSLLKKGYEVEPLPVDQEGVVQDVASRLRPNTSLVIVQLANSETGTVQDCQSIARLVPPHCRFHVDAVQAIGRIPLIFNRLGASTVSLSGHKIHGPAGIGALLVRPGIELKPLFHGGEQQKGARPGSEAPALIAGLSTAIELAVHRLDFTAGELSRSRDEFESMVMERIPDVVLNGALGRRLPNTSNISFLGASAEALLTALDLEGVCASAGTACASGSLEPSPVLLAMGISKERVDSALRFSLSRFTTREEIASAVDVLARVVDRVRQRMAD